MAPHCVLEALGVDFELILVDRKNKAQKSAEYIALNPNLSYLTIFYNLFFLLLIGLNQKEINAVKE